jgi:hypothetical protein
MKGGSPQGLSLTLSTRRRLTPRQEQMRKLLLRRRLRLSKSNAFKTPPMAGLSPSGAVASGFLRARQYVGADATGTINRPR